MSDDPIDWLVREFGAEVEDFIYDLRNGTSDRFHYAFISDQNADEWLIAYHVTSGGDGEWEVFGNLTKQPLTRADVARLCELFGVEVKRCSGRG